MRKAVFVVVVWNILVSSSGSVFGFGKLGISSDVFVISGGPVLSFATAFMGPILDKIGPKKTAVSGCLITATGYGILSLYLNSSDSNELWAYVGMALVSFGGIGPYLSSFNFANLFSEPEIAICAITGIFNLAGLDYAFLIEAVGLDPQSTCWVMGILQLLSAVDCLFLYPSVAYAPGDTARCSVPWRSTPTLSANNNNSTSTASPIDAENLFTSQNPLSADGAENYAASTDRRSLNSKASVGSKASSRRSNCSSFVEEYPIWNIVKPQSRASMTASFVGAVDASTGEAVDGCVPLCDQSFQDQICSIQYVLIVVWYTLNLTWMVYFFAYAGFVVNVGEFCDSVGYIGNVPVLMAGLPVLMGPVIGKVIGRCGFWFGAMICNILCVAMLLLLWVDSGPAQYAALVMFALQRSLTFAVFFSYVPVVFGGANYGKLIGLTTLIAGVFGFVNTPLALWADFSSDGGNGSCGGICTDWDHCMMVNTVIAACVVPLFGHSYLMWRWSASNSLAEHDLEELLR